MFQEFKIEVVLVILFDFGRNVNYGLSEKEKNFD